MGPAFRWYSGDWSTAPERFLSPGTIEILEPLASFVNDMSHEIEALEPVWQRWHAIAYDAARQIALPPSLATTPDCLVFVERDDVTLIDTAEDMLRVMPAARFHEVIPAWRHLATAARQALADSGAMARVRQQAIADATSPKTPDLARFPAGTEAAPDDLTAHLRSCGLRWYDLADQTGQLQRALAIADAASG